MLCTKSGYSSSVIFSLLAKSNARSKGILLKCQKKLKAHGCCRHLPDAFKMHRSDLDNMPHLLALQDAVAPTSSHASNIEKFRSIDHVIVYKRVSQNFI